MKKKVLIGVGCFVGVLILAILFLPPLLKPTIKKAADNFIAQNINADIVFPQDGLSVGMLRNFPNFNLTLKDLSVAGRNEFKGDTLVKLDKFEVVVNVFALISGNIEVNKIILDNPKINVKVLPNGKANYDIYTPKDTTTTAKDTTASEPVNFRLKLLALNNANILYSDQKGGIFANLKNLNIKGKGDLSQNIFDLSTQLTADEATVAMSGVEYLTKKSLDFNFVINMDMNKNKFTFKDNSIKINDFNFGFDGWLQMAEKEMNMDISFKALDNSFKGLLSLIPGIYTQSFGDIKADGDFDFSGYAKGTMKDSLLPKFGVKLVAKNASFQYPKVPQAITNINIDLNVENKTGLIPNTSIALNKFTFNIGKNPFDGYLKVANLQNFPVDAKINAKLNLGELTQAFPIEGMALKGAFALALQAKGVYDDKTGAFPLLNATAKLTNGFVKNSALPTPLENVNFAMTATNTTGKSENTMVNISAFQMLLAGEKLTASGIVQNLKDIAWDVKLNGGVNVGKMAEIFALKDMKLGGNITANIASSGKMSDVTAKKYANIKASGNMNIANFQYSSPDFKQGVTVSAANVTFNPASVNLVKFESKVGSSQISAKGSLSNYMGYLFKPNEVLDGNLTVNIPSFNANEWISSSMGNDEQKAKQEAATVKNDSTVSSSLIPNNINFNMSAHIGKFTYDNIVADNVNAILSLSKGIMTIKDANMNIIGGQVNVKGTFDGNEKKPNFDFDLAVKSISVPKAFETFEIVKKYAPIAKYVVGNMDLDFKLKGDLTKDMMPEVNTMSGGGLVKLLGGTYKDQKFTSLFSQYSKSETATGNATTFKEVAMSATLQDGKMSVRPFEIPIQGRKAVVSGYSELNGKMNYNVEMDVPANAVTSKLTSSLGKLTGKSAANQDMKLTLGLTGTYDKPSIKIINLASASGQSVQSEVKEAVQDKVKQEATKQVEKQVEKAASKIFGTSTSDTAKASAKEQVKEAAKNKLNSLFKKK